MWRSGRALPLGAGLSDERPAAVQTLPVQTQPGTLLY